MRITGVRRALVAVSLAASVGAVAAPAEQPRQLIYLHGRIVQEHQDARPRHPEWGYYELEQILDAFRERGFEVQSEIRPRSASVSDAAERVVEQVRQLLGAGVSADRITVVGASMGAAIALVASARLQNPEVRFGFLGACLAESVGRIRAEEGKVPSGRLLFIREASDEMSASCAPPKEGLEVADAFVAREVSIATGLSHGFLYRPLPDWLEPVVAWAEAAREESTSGGR